AEVRHRRLKRSRQVPLPLMGRGKGWGENARGAEARNGGRAAKFVCLDSPHPRPLPTRGRGADAARSRHHPAHQRRALEMVSDASSNRIAGLETLLRAQGTKGPAPVEKW